MELLIELLLAELIAIAVRLALAALLWVLGVSALVGVATLIVSLCFTSYLARLQSFLQDLIMHISDRRVSQISELLTSIKLIKLCAWERKFGDAVHEIREHEIEMLSQASALTAASPASFEAP